MNPYVLYSGVYQNGGLIIAYKKYLKNCISRTNRKLFVLKRIIEYKPKKYFLSLQVSF
jgi:hypothetical protein